MLLACGVARADVIYDNGLRNGNNGFETTHWIQADDFSLATSARANTIIFWTLELAGSVGFQGSFLWRIYSNSDSDTPKTPLFSGTDVHPSHIATGYKLGPYAEYAVTVNVGGLALPSGVYWLAIHNGPLTNDGVAGSVFWETTGKAGARTSECLISPFDGAWESNAVPVGSPSEVSFAISGILGPLISGFGLNNNALRISFTTMVNEFYRVEYKENLNGHAWVSLPGAEAVVGSGNPVSVNDPDWITHKPSPRYYRVSLCPCESAAVPQITAFKGNPGAQISFTTGANQTYQVQYKANLRDTSWKLVLGADAIAGTGNIVRITDADPNINTVHLRFYRVVLL